MGVAGAIWVQECGCGGWLNGLEEQWDGLEQQGIISPVDASTGAGPAIRAPKTHDGGTLCGNYKVMVNPQL